MATSEDFPLDSKDPQLTFKGGGSWNGIFCSKIKILIVAFVFVILVVVIVVLAVLLGAAQSTSNGRQESGTSGPTSSPLPTTPGTEAWWQIRLPRDIVPVHYNLFLNITVDLPRFDGHVEIYVNVTTSTDLILVHNNKITVSHVTVEPAGRQDSLPIKRHFWFKKNEFYVIQMKSALNPGLYVVKMKYSAFYDAGLRGLYRSTYKYPNGEMTNFAATQFEPVRARKALPCFDEPALKATFNVTIAHRPDYIALSNMPIYRSKLVNGQTHDYFKKTVVMPTYLLAFVVGDFKFKEIITPSGVKLRVYSRASVLNETSLAVNEGSRELSFFENYFNIKYSLPKLDMIGVPDFGAGAMENWGLVTYRERYLVWDPKGSSEVNKRSTANIISHELAHQWFGNIVTMKWWDDLWLNEGFATYMTVVATAIIHPTWGVRDSFIVKAFDSAIKLDGLVSSHPVKVNVNGPDEISGIFDAISYSKGASILRMLESFLGENIFSKGLTRYLNRHAFSNAEANDLWQALNDESCSRGSCVDVKHVMDTWTLQMGYPVVKLTKQNPTTYLVSQKHFLFDEKANISESKYKSPFNCKELKQRDDLKAKSKRYETDSHLVDTGSPYRFHEYRDCYTWVVPFTFVSENNNKKEIHWMDGGSITINDDSAWIKGNSGQQGFYIVNYENDNWKALKDQLNNNHTVLSIADRTGLIYDAFTLARGGQLSYENSFDMTKYIQKESEYAPWQAFSLHLDFLRQVLPNNSPVYKKLQKYLVHQTKEQYNRLGFSNIGSQLEIFLRGILLEANCMAGVTSCINNATQRFTQWMNNPKQKIAPNLRSLVLKYGVAHGGVKEWDFVYEQYQKTDSPNEQHDFLQAMASSREAWIIARYLEYAIDPTKFKKSKIRIVASFVAENPVGNRVAWDYFRIHWNRISKLYGSGDLFAYGRVLSKIPKYFSNNFELNELIKFNKEVEGRTGAQSGTMLQNVEGVKANIEWLQKNTETIDKWLTKYITDNKI